MKSEKLRLVRISGRSTGERSAFYQKRLGADCPDEGSQGRPSDDDMICRTP